MLCFLYISEIRLIGRFNGFNFYNKGGFGVSLMAKDLGLAQSAAVNAEATIPLGSLAHQIYRAIIAQGFAKKDFSFVYQFLKGTR